MRDWWEKQSAPFICHYCGKSPLVRGAKVKPSKRATADHYIPKFRKGSQQEKNIVIACGSCNRDKGVLMPDEWKAVLEYRKVRDLKDV